MNGLVAQLSALVAQLLVIAAAAQQRWETVIAPQPILLVWPLLFAVGVGLVIGLGSRPLPLAERVRRLNLEVRMRETAEPPVVDGVGAHVLLCKRSGAALALSAWPRVCRIASRPTICPIL